MSSRFLRRVPPFLGFWRLLVVALFLVGCAASPDEDAAGASAELSTVDLRKEEARLRDEATRLAGAPADIPQRVVFLHEIYVDSKGNHAFPEVALHGALWAHDFFRSTRLLRDFGGLLLGFLNQRSLVETVDAFALAIKTTNRQVFIDTYTSYWFTKKYGRHAGASAIVDADVLPSLNKVHAAVASGTPLSAAEKRAVFLATLETERKDSVARMMDEAARDIRPFWLKELMMRPVVQFAYFGPGTAYVFEDFSDRDDRVRCATRAYDLAVKAGWEMVTASMEDYSALPDAYFSDRAGYAAQLRARLLAR